jgi:hypothetical protein
VQAYTSFNAIAGQLKRPEDFLNNPGHPQFAILFRNGWLLGVKRL